MNTATLERATITVARIISAKDRGKSATIKDIDGRMFGIWPDKLGLVNDGGCYEIDFSETVKNGTTYRDIKAIRQIQHQVPPRAQAASRGGDPFVVSTEMREQRKPQEPGRQPPQYPQNGNGNGYYRPTAPRDAERMFVCSTLNAFIQTGRVDATGQTLVDYVNTLREVWQATFGQDDRA